MRVPSRAINESNDLQPVSKVGSPSSQFFTSRADAVPAGFIKIRSFAAKILVFGQPSCESPSKAGDGLLASDGASWTDRTEHTPVHADNRSACRWYSAGSARS